MLHHENQMWNLIESTRDKAEYTLESHVEKLESHLLTVSDGQFFLYCDEWKKTVNQLYDYPHWLAFNIVLNGKCNEDRFDDFSNSLMLTGRQLFNRILYTPDRLADFDVVRICEKATGLFEAAWDKRCPGEILMNGSSFDWKIRDFPKSDLVGQKSETKLEKMFPNLCRKYGCMNIE